MNIAAKKAVSLILSAAVLLSPTIYSGAFAASETTSLQTGTAGNYSGQYSMDIARSLAGATGPTITQDLQDQTVNIGDKVVLSISVSGSGNFLYSWYKNNQPIEVDSIHPTHTIASASTSDEGNYFAFVRNLDNGDTATSSTMKLTVNSIAAPKVNPVECTDTAVTGTAQPDSTVTVEYLDGSPAGTATADSTGAFTVPIRAMPVGATLIVIASANGIKSPTTSFTVGIPAPKVNPVKYSDTKVTGTTQPGASINVKWLNDLPLGSTTADSTGAFSMPISAMSAGTMLDITASLDGNTSPTTSVVVSGVSAPTVNPVKYTDTKVTGTTDPGAQISVEFEDRSSVLGNGKADANGAFSVPICNQSAGTIILVFATAGGKESPATSVKVGMGTVVTGFAALGDTVKNQSVSAGAIVSHLNFPENLTVTGEGITGKLIHVTAWTCSNYNSSVAGIYTFHPTIDNHYTGEGYVDSGFSVTGDLPTITVTVKSASSPTVTVNPVKSSDAAVTGTTQPGATVTVKWASSGLPVGNATANSTGAFSVPMSAQPAGTVLLVTSFLNGDTSPAARIVVGDSSSEKPVISGFSDLGNTVKNQTFSISDVLTSLKLPEKLAVIGSGITGMWVRVSAWVCSTFTSPVAGTYTFHAVLDSGYTGEGYVDSGYTLASLVNPPTITVTVKDNNSNNPSNGGSSDHSTHTSSQPVAPHTETQVNPTGNTATVTTVADSVTQSGDTAQIAVTIPSVTVDTTGTNASLNASQKASVSIDLPKDAILQQFAAKKDVDLTLTVPHAVAQDTTPNLAVTIKASADIIAAAKADATDVTIHIKDADTQQLTYSWTFKGADLAKSTTPVTDVNISMSIRLTTEVAQVNKVTPTNKGLVLMFDHSGVLPSVASVTFSAKEKGFQPGQKLFFYYYNPKTGQIDAQNQEYTVGPDGMVTVQIFHCSNYVLLPNKARTIALDTRAYTLAPGNSYVTGVKLTGVSGTTIKAYSSTQGVADVTVLKNGNVKAVGLKAGMTYIMIDVYDSKKKVLTHASVRLTVKNSVKPNGNSARQYGLF